MTDVDRLQSWFASGRLLRPDQDVPNTVDVARALATAAGATRFRNDAGAKRVSRTIGPGTRTVLVLVDGLGMELLERLPADSFFRRNLKLELRSVFPSSTAPALTTLATGLWPSEHAVPSWFVYLPRDRVTATILPFVDRFGGRDLGERGVPISRAFPAAGLMSGLTRETVLVMPERIVDSVYTRYISGGREGRGYSTTAAACDAIGALLARRRTPLHVHFYIPDVDAATHAEGTGSRAALGVAARVEAELAELTAALAGRARMVVTADHGGIDPAPSDRLTVEADDPLLKLLAAPPSGEPRAPVFHVRRRRDVARFRFELSERLGERWALLAVDEVESLGLLGPGPLARRTRERLGDFMAIAGGAEVLLYGPEGAIAAMRGFHGGMTPAEMRIPLIVA